MGNEADLAELCEECHNVVESMLDEVATDEWCDKIIGKDPKDISTLQIFVFAALPASLRNRIQQRSLAHKGELCRGAYLSPEEPDRRSIRSLVDEMNPSAD